MRDLRSERRFASLRRRIDRRVAGLSCTWAAPELSAACRHVLEGGGKRIRGALVLLGCEAVGGDPRRALGAAAAVEAMHNFTLVHDDIMDHAATRRGRPTVHTRWNLNTALLAGDVLLGLSFNTIARSARDARALDLFTRGVLEVCEGQALDIAFERRQDVTVREYFGMIELKTARLLALSAELGGLIGGGSARERALLRRFGLHLGRAFQVQDDLLDVIADRQRFGKRIGGDIVERKRTFLLINALERARGADRLRLRRLLAAPPAPSAARGTIRAVTEIYRRSGAIEAARRQIARDSRRATTALDRLPVNPGTRMLRWLAGVLVHRDS